jgi:hypothetical protein
VADRVAKLLDRLTGQNSSGVAFRKLWQKNCELIEAQFSDVFLALASISEVAPIVIVADYTGVVNPADQLPYQVAIKRFSGDTDVTTLTAWSLTADAGITATIGASTGLLSITAITASGTITVSSIYNGITKTKLVPVTLSIGATPSTGSGGGGSTSSDTTFNSISSATHAAISDELTVTVGSSGTVTLNAASLTVRTTKDTTGTFPVYGLWRWWNGAAWADVGTEVQSSPDCTLDYDSEVGIYFFSPSGSLTVNTSKTGLGVGTSQKFQLYARNSSGTRTMTFTGTASAIP